MTQLTLFATPVLVPSPCWRYTPCQPRAKAVKGPAIDHGGCVNHVLSGTRCPATWEVSTRKESPCTGVS
jgi:hypothetical protein